MAQPTGTILSLNLTKFIFSILACLLICGATARAQTPILQQSYSFSKESYSIYELTTVLQQQADISVSYDAHKIKSNTTIKLPKPIMNTKELVVLLNKHYQIESKFIGRHIILKKDEKAIVAVNKPKRKKQKTAPKNVATQSAVKTEPKTAAISLPKINPQPPKWEARTLDTIAAFKDTFSVDASNLEGLGWEVSAQSAFITFNKDIDRLDEPETDRTGNPWYQRFGFSVNVNANEFFYVNPTAELHWSNFSATAQYAMRNGAAHYRFGLAYKKPLNASASLSLWLNYGNLPVQNKSIAYGYDSIVSTDPDSPLVIRIEGSEAYTLSSNLLKLGVDFNWKLGRNLDLFSGITLNRSQTDIVHNGVSKAPALFFPAQVSLQASDFEMLPQFLRVNDNFSLNQSRYNRLWLGFQVGLRFYIVPPKNKWE